ncbi:MAG: glycogen/starch/alpha-glucan phosphorylase [Clostridia bacterium]|nr:glycogen/starch/alpha-glucan phosphorylase [Clostridia bacterium]
MISSQKLWQLIDESLSRNYGVSPNEASVKQMYSAVALVVKNILLVKRKSFNSQFKKEGKKRVHYLSMEFLVGRSLKNNIYNLGITKQLEEALDQHGFILNQLYEQESDAGLGNGGLGRLAACYFDALATGNYPATGHCLRYEYGIFSQKLIDGWQTELPDNWLPSGEVWLTQRADKAVTVKFGGRVNEQWQQNRMVSVHTDYEQVEAMPYDLMISGYDSDAVAVLRLWSARNKHTFDMHAFSQGEYVKALQKDTEAEIITKVLYPADDNIAGKSLRLKQQYFLVSSALQDITNDHLKRNNDLSNLPEQVAIHINDTHPVLAIPELMRILLDEQGFDWDKSWDITTRTCAYTNHTVMSEALEVWGEEFFQRVLPRLYDIVKEINKRASADMWNRCKDWKKVSDTAVIAYDQIRMANLAVVGSHVVNGVSQLHTDILERDLFKEFYRQYPDKFVNVTNGIAMRRWLCQSNVRLTHLLDETIGREYIYDFALLKQLEKYKDDKSVLSALSGIKQANKVEFANYIAQSGVIIDPTSRFDVQVKRLHEYKRQLLNALRIIALYRQLKDNPNMDMVPQTFIFGAKAASSYYMAKDIIKLIYKLGESIRKDKRVNDILNVVFLENYNVTLAERLIPCSEVSQQISLAGKEASGTGNMKFMVNGAITMGTLDGANVEIAQAVGKNNIIIFGLNADQVSNRWQAGYNSMDYYFVNNTLRAVIDELNVGFDGADFGNIVAYLLKNNIPDPYMCIADFDDYIKAQARLDSCYADKMLWNKMSLINIANAGRFSADRSIKEYADKIWNMSK